MFNARRMFRYLATGVMPERTALDEAIEREETRRGVSDDLLDEMLTFLRGTSQDPQVSHVSSPRVSPASRVPQVNAQDAAPSSLADHDEQYHPDGYEEGDSCKFREERAKGDGADVGVEEGQRSEVRGQTKELAKSSLSNKKRKEYGDLMRRKHPDIDADALLTELGKIGDRKLQGDAFRWAMKGCELPRDLEKMKQARELAEKAKVDPLQYDSPQGCIDALTGKVEIKEKPIDPDTVPELSNKKTFPMGVTTYQVQDDAQGQQKMREIINTHWGKDANPWCLLHGDGKGNLTTGDDADYDAEYYWNVYNSLPKRVAFKDGKLQAFMATDDAHPLIGGYRPNEKWWDRQDKDHVGIPVGNVPVEGDEFGRWADFEIRDGKAAQVGGYHKGERGHDGFVEWRADGGMDNARHDGMTYRWRTDGSLATVETGSGTRYNFNPDGSFAGYFKDFVRQSDPDETTQRKIKSVADGIKKKYAK